jgi:hypothetical protein
MNILLVLISLLILGIIVWLFLSEKEEAAATREQDEGQLPDRALRRRASDKQIEEEAKKQRRKTDTSAQDDEVVVADEEFKLPYLTDEIIPEGSRFRVYRRTLLNSEVYAKKGYYDTSINLYEGVAARINDIKTKEKIEDNIAYLKHYMKQKEDAKSKAVRDSIPESVTSGDLKFTVDGNKQKRINIEVFDDVTKQSLLEMEARLRRELKDEFETLKPPDLGPPQEKDISELRDRLDDLHEKLDQREYDYLDIDNRAKQSDLDVLNDELEDIKDIVGSFKDELSDLDRGADGQPDDAGERFDGLMDHIDTLNRKINEIAEKEPEKPEPTPVVLDPQPFVDLFNKITEGGIPEGRKPEAEKPKPEIIQAEDGRPSQQYAPGKPEVSEKIENKTSTTREEEDEDLNEFDLLQDITKPKIKDELSDEEIFEKIIRDAKKSQKDDEDSFEIMGERSKDEGQYDVFNKEEELKKQEEDKFYKNFVKTDRKLKKELPILKVNFDFSKLPEQMHLSREQNILEYSFYKYKPMLVKAGELIKKRRVREAIDYYKVVMGQNIPPEFKMMIRKNITDLTEYLEKYLSTD